MERVEAVTTFIDAVAERHKSNQVWAMFSGGDDSLANTIATARAQKFSGCLHLDTGIGIPETREFVRETCKAQGWPLKVYKAKDCGQDYERLVMERGFPGPAMHYKMYSRLKERPLRVFMRDYKAHRHDRIVLSTGARSQESTRRMGHVQPERRQGVYVWVNPLHDWSKSECLDLIAASGVPRSPVVELLHMSGECLCGAFAAPNELAEISLWYPEFGRYIAALQERVKAAGKHCVWGTSPPRKRLTFGQRRRDSAGRVTELCQQCELRF